VIRVKQILKDYNDSGALHALVNIHAAVGDNVFLTKGGDLVMLLQMRGADPDCLALAEKDRIARRFESALRLFDEHFTINQYIVKRDNAAIPYQHHSNPLVEKACAARRAHLTGQGRPSYSIDAYVAVVYEDWLPTRKLSKFRQFLRAPRSTWRHFFSTQPAAAGLSAEMDRARDHLATKVTSFIVQLRDVLTLELLDVQRGFAFLRRLLNYESFKEGLRLRFPQFADFQACGSSLECHRDHLRLDDYFVQVLTLKEPPARTFAHLFNDLAEVPSNCIISSEWHRAGAAGIRRLIQSKRRHFYNGKTSLASHFSTGATSAPRDRLVDDGAVALVSRLGTCLEEIEVHGRSFGEFSMTVVLYNKDRAELRKSVAECFKVFTAHDAQLTDERYNLLNAWLAVLPGNRAHNLRRLWLLDNNYADLSFLFTPNPGNVRNLQLGAEYLAVFETAGGMPYFFNLHYKDVAHTLVLGATGSGKSFLLNFLLTHLQKYNPLTFIFDLGGSYESLTRLLGGSYLPVANSKQAFTINPFCLPPTPENIQFLYGLLKVLIESTRYTMDADDNKDLFEQIENLYEIAPDQRRLLTLSNILRSRLRAQLQPWVAGGPHAWLFDHVEDNLTFARFQTFDFEGMDKFPEQLEPLLFYILHRASAAIQDPAQASLFKTFVMDEAWRFFRHPAIKGYIVEALKTWRKKNAAMILATQSTEDLLNSGVLSVVVESCPTKLFLANPEMDRDTYRRLFHLNDTETDAIAGLVPRGEFLLKRPDLSKRLILSVEPKSYWLYTNNPQDNRARREAFERHGFEDGLHILAGRTS
jgi:type IV secretion system protein VirB4